MRSACGMERPVTPSRPDKMMGSMAPSSSMVPPTAPPGPGSPSSESFHSSKVWKVGGASNLARARGPEAARFIDH